MGYNWEIIGHEKILEKLERDIASGNVAHAYLFSGPAAIGKYTLAQKFAAALQCADGYCRTCTSCDLAQKGLHPDIALAPDDGESLKIEAIRELIRKSNLSSQSKHRIFVIQNIERMPMEAQNSFLKTLEEPPGQSLFILTTSQVGQVLSTILSRVRQIDFSGVSDVALKAALEVKYGPLPQLSELVNLAQGQPGFAIQMLQSPDVFQEQKDLYARIEKYLSTNDLMDKFAFVEEISADEKQVERFLDAFARYLRKVLYDFVEQPSHALSERFTAKDLTDLFESFEETRYLIQRNVNRKLALEGFLLKTEKQK